MLGILLVQVGLAFTLVGLVALIRPIRWLGLAPRRRGAGLALFGATVGALGALLPAPDLRAPTIDSRIDATIPVWQFAERHTIHVAAPPAAVERAIREVTASEIRGFRALTWIRSPRWPWSEGRESILAPDAVAPILDVALRSGFQPLADEAGRELVFGTLVIVPRSIRELAPEERERRAAELTPARFVDLEAPGFAKAVMNFRWTEAAGGGTDVVTETRVVATDPAARRRFAAYWRLIYPGSSFIRSAWLEAIRRRAEAAG